MRSLSSVLIFATLAVFVQGLKDEECFVSGPVCGNVNGVDTTFGSCYEYLDTALSAKFYKKFGWAADTVYLVSADGGCILNEDTDCEDKYCDSPIGECCEMVSFNGTTRYETIDSHCSAMADIRCSQWRALFSADKQEQFKLVSTSACPSP